MKIQVKQLIALVLMLASMILILSLMPEHDFVAHAPASTQMASNQHPQDTAR